MSVKGRYQSLDGLRGIAVLMVFLSHTSGRDQFIPYLNFHGIGHIGVYLFFALSAFLLGKNLFSTDLTLKAVKDFYIKRILRILPLYYLVLFGVYFYQQGFGISPTYLKITGGLSGFIEHMYLYRGDSLFWSVVAELHFYMIVPFIVYLLHRFRDIALAGLLLIAGVNAALYFIKYIHWPVYLDWIKYLSLNDRDSGSYIDLFIIGLVPAYLIQFKKAHLEKFKQPIILVSTVLFFLVMAATLIFVAKNFLVFNQEWFALRYVSFVFAIIFPAFILSLMLGNPYVSFLNAWWIRQIGIIGFSFYLLHFPVIQFVNTFELAPVVKLFISFALCSVLCKITFELVESTSIKIAQRIVSKKEAKPEMVNAA